ncbi:MAG: hypothetical protein LQ342_004032 [Letrouitia transgressa]|nr:MAG: hypothetical protein LQ342_004032 [Letrouitia transgressa]
MAKIRVSKIPSPYSPLPFHILRLAQLLSASIVSCVVLYFVHFLRIEHYAIPWTFILVRGPIPQKILPYIQTPTQLLTVSFLTLAALASSSALYHFRTLPPKFNLTNNASLLILWILGLSFIAWNIGWTLGHRCTLLIWKSQAGIMVCRLYKACTAFTVTGLYAPVILQAYPTASSVMNNNDFTVNSVSTLLTTLLDVKTYYSTTQLGKYNHMQDVKHPAYAPSPPAHDDYRWQRHNGLGEYHVENPYNVQRPIEARHFGYSQPEEQTRYDGPVGGHW